MIQAINTFFIHALIILSIFSHTIYTSYILQTIVLSFVFFLWIYIMYVHLYEKQVAIEDEYSILHPFLESVYIEPTPDVMRASILTLSTSAVFFLGLEWIFRTIEKLHQASNSIPSYVASCLPKTSCSSPCCVRT
jgi:hypothetical protein